MPLGKRRSTYSYAARAKRARLTGSMTKGTRALRSRMFRRPMLKPNLSLLAMRVNNLNRMIETKEAQRKSGVNVALPHNGLHVVDDDAGGLLNIFRLAGQGAADPMEAGNGNRVGDQITVKGVMIKGFMENALARPRVFYRIMLLRGAKGETFNKTNIFKGDSNNKMIDQVNTERFSVVAQKIFTINASNVAASGTETPSGAPLIATAGGIGSRTFKMWIPGYKFGRGGNIQYENGNASQVKFYDYRICIVVYDWYGTPETGNVGRINELYTKMYFKDA